MGIVAVIQSDPEDTKPAVTKQAKANGAPAVAQEAKVGSTEVAEKAESSPTHQSTPYARPKGKGRPRLPDRTGNGSQACTEEANAISVRATLLRLVTEEANASSVRAEERDESSPKRQRTDSPLRPAAPYARAKGRSRMD